MPGTIDTEKLLQHLEDKWKDKSCPMCGHLDWTLKDTISEIRDFSGGGLIIGRGQPLVPVIPVTCNYCGNTVLINAIVAGILEKGGKEEGMKENKAAEEDDKNE